MYIYIYYVYMYIYIHTPNTVYPYYIPILPCKKYTIDGSSAAHAPLEVNETKRAALIREEKRKRNCRMGPPSYKLVYKPL